MGAGKPALLANAVEAVIAAMYLDGGLETARKFIEVAVVAPEMEALREALKGSTGGALRDHKTLLQERVQATGAGQAALHRCRADRAGASATLQR